MGKGRLTPQSSKFCELMAEGKKTQYECYVEAYPSAKNWAKGSAQAAASALAKKPHIQERIGQLKQKIEEKLVERYVWDKQKSTKILMRALDKVDKSLEILSEETNKIVEQESTSTLKIKAIKSSLYSINDATRVIKELSNELNTMYGFNKANLELSGSMQQVVFTGEDELPPDDEEVDNNGNELVEEDLDGEDTKF